MAGRDIAIGGMLNAMLFPGSEDWGRLDNPMGRPSGAMRDDTSVHAIQKAPNGKVMVTFNTPSMTPMDAVARENFRRLGMDSSYIGRKAVRLEGKYDGDNLSFDVGGKQISLNEKALYNARGTELANLLGMNSFMDFNRAQATSVQNAIKLAPTGPTPPGTELAPMIAGKEPVPIPAARPPELGGTAASTNPAFSSALPQQNIPQMLTSAPNMLPMPQTQAFQGATGGWMMPGPMIPTAIGNGMQSTGMPMLAMPGMQPQYASKQSKKGIPGFGSDINPLGPWGSK